MILKRINNINPIIIFNLIILIMLYSSCTSKNDIETKRFNQIKELDSQLTQLLPKNSTPPKQIENNIRQIPTYKIKVINTFPHDYDAYTQGLIFHNGFLFESTGLNGKSSLRKIDLKTGKILKKIDLSPQIFAEGITIYNNKIYQLTWTNQTCIVYDLNTFDKITEFSYSGEGWGITTINNIIITSNGTHSLVFRDANSFNIIKSLNIFYDNVPLNNLNELEYINGEIWANIYFSNKIVTINPNNGEINSFIDLTPLYSYIDKSKRHDVLNGIAYDNENKRIFVTGKYWEFIFQIEIIKQ